MAHNLDTLLDAAEILQNSNQSNVKLLFLGDGACKVDVVQKANDRGLENVIFLNSVPKDEVARYLSILDVSIIHLRKDDLFKTDIPSNFFESVAMGIPLIHAVEGESTEIVEKINVEYVFHLKMHRQWPKQFLNLKINLMTTKPINRVETK